MRRATRPRRRLAGGGEKGGFADTVAKEIAGEIEALIGGPIDTWDFEAIEFATRRKAMHVVARAIEARLNADHSDKSAATLACPACGGPARYVDRRPKAITSAVGELRPSRAYYHCDQCHSGFCPRDRALGIEGSSLSPRVLRMVGHVAHLGSFEEGHESLLELADIDVSTKQVEREAERLGREIAEDEKHVVEPEADGELPSTLYMGLDGTGIPMCKSELDGRKGKQEDGSSKTREVKLVTTWSAEGRDEDGVPVCDEDSVSYSAAIESAATRDTDKEPPAFAQRVIREAARRRFSEAKWRVILGDGALWIWNIATEHFPDAIQIVDRYHANEHLRDAAKAIYGHGSDLGRQWAHERCTELKAGNIDAVLAALAVHSACEEASKCSEYLRTNRHRMRYAEFHEAGLCTSTGVLESGCKRAIGLRLKRGGMFWTVKGGDAVIALRCCKLSGRFEDFWERRASSLTG
jgi:hypothetical protein